MSDDSRKEMLKMLADREGHLEKLKRIRDKKKERVEEDKKRQYKKPERGESSIEKNVKEAWEDLKGGVAHHGESYKKAKKDILRKIAGKKD